MPKCCVRFCFSTSTKSKDNEMLFFPWPKKEKITEKWLHEFAVNCNVTGYTKQFFKITRNMRICNLHFESSCFSNETNKLLKDAVPTIFQFTKKVIYLTMTDSSYNSYVCLIFIFSQHMNPFILMWYPYQLL